MIDRQNLGLVGELPLTGTINVDFVHSALQILCQKNSRFSTQWHLANKHKLSKQKVNGLLQRKIVFHDIGFLETWNILRPRCCWVLFKKFDKYQ